MDSQLKQFIDNTPYYDITTNMAFHDEESGTATFKTIVQVLETTQAGTLNIKRKVSATKTCIRSEEVQDYIGAAELGSIKRCLTYLGYEENN